MTAPLEPRPFAALLVAHLGLYLGLGAVGRAVWRLLTGTRDPGVAVAGVLVLALIAGTLAALLLAGRDLVATYLADRRAR